MKHIYWSAVVACLGLGCGVTQDSSSLQPDGGVTDGGSLPKASNSFKRVFVTSSEYSANFKSLGLAGSGLGGADALCTMVAKGAGWSGQFKAWLSSDSTSAVSRIADVGPWYQVKKDGTKIKTFNNKANLYSTPLEPLEFDQNGDPQSWKAVWTGTNVGGSAGLSCENFENYQTNDWGQYGRTSSTSSNWTDEGIQYCYLNAHLYCFEQ